jgi:DNA-binding response OmpR family regulator
VLYVEDEPSISEPLTELLQLEGYDVVVAETLAGALDCVGRVKPDVVLLDLMLPDGSGRDLCRALRRDSDVPIVMLTARGEMHDRIVGLEIGADDYVVKPFEGAEVIARIGAILRRVRRDPAPHERMLPAEPPRPTTAAQPGRVGNLSVDLDARRVWREGAEVTLSRKEFDLFAVLLRNAGRVVRREDLMAEVWDENWWGSTRTLDVHVGSLRRKLGDERGGTRMIQTVRGVGFRLCRPEAESSG